MDFTSNVILEMFKKEGKTYIRFNMNNKERNVFGAASSVTELEEFIKILDSQIDPNFAKNCGVENYIVKTDVKLYTVFLILSLLVLGGLIFLYFYLKRREREKELSQSIDEERLIL